MKKKHILILIMLLLFVLVFATSCGSESDSSINETQEVAVEEPPTPPVLAAEQALCDIKIIEQMYSTGGRNGNTRFETIVQFVYVDNNGIMQYQIKPLNEVQIQQTLSDSSLLIRYEGDTMIYLCVTPDLYRELL